MRIPVTLFVLFLFCNCQTTRQPHIVTVAPVYKPDKKQIISDSLYFKTHKFFKNFEAQWSYSILFPFTGIDSICVCNFYFFYTGGSAANKLQAEKSNRMVVDSLGRLFTIPALKKASGCITAYALDTHDTLATRFFIY